jgi:hypothetical protein
LEDQSGEVPAAEAGQKLPAAERDATARCPLPGEKLTHSTVRFGLACGFYPAHVPVAVHWVNGFKLDLLVRFLQHHFRRFSMASRARPLYQYERENLSLRHLSLEPFDREFAS